LKAAVVIPPDVQAVIEEVPPDEQDALVAKLELLERFPRMFQIRERGRFRRHRRFLVRNWVVHYRVVENTVFIRGIWPARLP
jgi:mRNA-degrading endonuclease RelE of RelBE toxin-antitoxin system